MTRIHILIKRFVAAGRRLPGRGAVRHVRGEAGSFLVGVIVVTAMISILSVTALTVLYKEKMDVTDDLSALTASSAARSCMELAKAQTFPHARLSNLVKEYQYGEDRFRPVGDLKARCTVTAQIRSGKVLLESTAKVYKDGTSPEAGIQILGQQTLKALYRIRGGRVRTLWQVSASGG